MSSQIQGTLNPRTGFALRKRLLGLGAIGGTLTAIAAILAMTTAVGGSVLLTNTAGETATRPAVAAPAAVARATTVAARPAAAATKNVMIQNYAFTPASLTIAVGDTVTWTNMDTAPHTVTVSSGPVKFASPTLQKGETFTYTFTAPGTYSYYCAVHPDMMAKVIVTGSGSSPTPPVTPTTPTPTMPMPAAGSCGGAMSALDTFMQHLYAGHLETSVGQQVSDITDANQYVKTHTVLVENMIKPLLGGSGTC